MAGGVGRLLVAADEGVAGGEPLRGALDAPAQVADRVVALGLVDRLEADCLAEPAEERRLGDEAPLDAVPFAEARELPRPAPPLQRGDVEALALEAPHHLPCPRLGRARRPLGLGDERLRAQDRVPRAEEGVRVGDAVVGAGSEAQDRLPAPDVREREDEAVDLDPVEAGDEPLGLLRVPLGMGPADEPPAVVPPLRQTQRRVREHVLRRHLLPAPERLEHGSAGELVRRVAEHRPVRDLARRRPSRADRVEDAAGALLAEPVEVRRRRGFVPCQATEHGVRAIAEPVEEDHDDRQHAASLTLRPARRALSRWQPPSRGTHSFRTKFGGTATAALLRRATPRLPRPRPGSSHRRGRRAKV